MKNYKSSIIFAVFSHNIYTYILLFVTDLYLIAFYQLFFLRKCFIFCKKKILLHSQNESNGKLSDGVTGNTTDFGSVESRFEP
jgi:hypothetical protein